MDPLGPELDQEENPGRLAIWPFWAVCIQRFGSPNNESGACNPCGKSPMAGIYMVEEPMNADILQAGVAIVPADTLLTDHQLPLLEAFRTQGDREALNALFTTLGPMALALAFRRLADVAAAEDVVQEACLDLIAGCRSYQSGRGTIKAWFMGMVLNRCRMYERSKERRQRHEGAVPPPTPSATPPDSDLIEAVRLAVQELPEHERSTIELRFLIGLECKDVAASLGRPEKTIRSQVDRALVRLKEILLKKGIGPVEAEIVSGAMVLPVVSMSEGFIKSLTVTAHSAVVPASGRWHFIIGSRASVVVNTGKTVVKFPSSTPSPSHTWVAEITPGLNVFLRDPRSGQVRWSLSLPDSFIAEAKPTSTQWSPYEDRLAVTFADRVCVAWVDLFPTRPAPKDLATTVRLVQESQETPVEAVLQLIAAGAPAVQAIGEPRSFAAIIALERLAAGGIASAKESLEKAAKTSNLAAQDALARLQRAQEAKKRWDTPLNIQVGTPETKAPKEEKPKKTGVNDF